MNDSYAQENGHPPVARRVVCVDFDGVVQPWGPLDGSRPPFNGVREALHTLRKEGFRIVILTSRLSPTWWEDEVTRNGEDPVVFGAKQALVVANYMRENDLPYDRITSEKIPAEAYFDDRAVRVNPNDWWLLDAVRDFLWRGR